MRKSVRIMAVISSRGPQVECLRMDVRRHGLFRIPLAGTSVPLPLLVERSLVMVYSGLQPSWQPVSHRAAGTEASADTWPMEASVVALLGGDGAGLQLPSSTRAVFFHWMCWWAPGAGIEGGSLLVSS